MAPKYSMLISDAIVRVLENAGTKYVFGVAGSTSASLLSSVSFSKNMEFIPALHENASLGMADGYARGSGRFGVVVLHTTPGLTTALPNLYNSFVDGVPILVLVGDVNSKSLITEPALALNGLTSLAKGVTKWSVYASHSSDVMIALRRALSIVHSSEPGPCCIVIPEDVLEEESSTVAVAGSFEKTEVFPNPRGVRKAVELLGSASWPILLIGRQVQSREAVKALSEMCERLAVPVLVESPYPSAYCVGFPQSHPCYMGTFRRDAEALNGCDLIVAVGGQLLTERRYSEGEPFSPRTKVVHVNSNPWELGKNIRTDLKLVASPEQFAIQMSRAALEGSGSGVAVQQRWAEIQKMSQSRADQHRKLMKNRGDGTSIKPWRLVEALKRALEGKDYVIVDEGVISSSYLSELFEFNEVGTLIGRSAGCLGWGLSAAVGVKLARPEKKVVAYVGDGALLFGPQALWTASHRRIPLTVVVCNNQGYTSVSISFESLRRRTGRPAKPVGCEILDPQVDVAALCAALGAKCQTVAREADLLPSLRSAIGSEDGVRVVDVRIDGAEKGYEVSSGGSSAWT